MLRFKTTHRDTLDSGHFGGCAMEGLVAGVLKSQNPTVLRVRKITSLRNSSVLWKGYFGLLRDHFGQCAVEEQSWATGRPEVQSSKNLTTPQSYGWGKTCLTSEESQHLPPPCLLRKTFNSARSPHALTAWIFLCVQAQGLTHQDLRSQTPMKDPAKSTGKGHTSVDWTNVWNTPRPLGKTGVLMQTQIISLI